MKGASVRRWADIRGFRSWAVIAMAVLSMLVVPDADARKPAAKGHAAKSVAAKKAVAGKKSGPAARGKSVVVPKGKRANARGRAIVRKPVEPPVLSVGQLAGLHSAQDPLELKSSVALVIDRDTNQVLLSKNPNAVLPIASITKLMTALVVVEAGQSMDEPVAISQEDLDATANNRSRLLAGTELPRGEMLRLALMSSENRAANSLSRHFPGGATAFVAAMNHKASQLGMRDTRFVEPTGLSPENRSSANDLIVLVGAASNHQLIRDLSTSHDAQVAVGARQVQFRTTNLLVTDPTWEIALQKTGYIAAAGRCLVMQAQMAGRRLTMVLLDSAGKYSRLGDAERIRQWLAASPLANAHASVRVAVPVTR
jgi:serine-type D-Ala-D-Ala endopeptidase (penicillin-binding protein 7)